MMWPGRQKFGKIGFLRSVTSMSREPLFGRRTRRVEELEVVQPLEIEAEHPARPVYLERFRFLQPMPKRVDSNVPALPFSNITSAITASSTARSARACAPWRRPR